MNKVKKNFIKETMFVEKEAILIFVKSVLYI